MCILRIICLNVSFPSPSGVVQASSGIRLEMKPGETRCLIGESGCGKSIVALSIMRLLPENACVSGEILFNGRDLLSLSEREMRKVRGREISMIFEQPQSCLNPLFPVEDQIAEAVKSHDRCSHKARKERAAELMKRVGLPGSAQKGAQYPHEYSGGMAQRAMIAMAMASRPSLLIADEPTTSLDGTTQARVLGLLKDLVSHYGMSLLLITHDLETAFWMCEHVSVMYAGSLVETGTVRALSEKPKHPYTKALIGALEDAGNSSIRGTVPELTRLPPGCPFHPRCPDSQEICHKVVPSMKRGARCHLHMKM